MDKDRRREVDEAIKRAKKAIKQKDVQSMLDCASRLERLIPGEYGE